MVASYPTALFIGCTTALLSFSTGFLLLTFQGACGLRLRFEFKREIIRKAVRENMYVVPPSDVTRFRLEDNFQDTGCYI